MSPRAATAGVSEVRATSPVVVDVSAARAAAPGVSSERLEAAYAQCGVIARRRARNFYYGLRLTPEPRRSAIYSIYAWMRSADDVADAPSPASERRARLARHRETTRRILDGEPAPTVEGDGTFWPAFAATAASYPIQSALFGEMLDGLEDDIEHPGFETEAELWRYCYRVASTVGLTCVAIWGTSPGADAALVRDLAIRRGQAFQRTNILRDFAQDFDCAPRRLYLPREAWVRHGVTGAQVRRWEPAEVCRALILEEAARAREFYRTSEGLERLIDPVCAPTLWAMTRIYSGLLDIVEADPERIVRARRVRLASARKAGIALAATWRARRGRW